MYIYIYICAPAKFAVAALFCLLFAHPSLYICLFNSYFCDVIMMTPTMTETKWNFIDCHQLHQILRNYCIVLWNCHHHFVAFNFFDFYDSVYFSGIFAIFNIEIANHIQLVCRHQINLYNGLSTVKSTSCMQSHNVMVVRP